MQFQGFDWLSDYGTVYEPLYHAIEIATIKLSSGYSLISNQNQQELAIFLDCF